MRVVSVKRSLGLVIYSYSWVFGIFEFCGVGVIRNFVDFGTFGGLVCAGWCSSFGCFVLRVCFWV